MKVLITGESGFVGKNLARACAQRGDSLFFYRRRDKPSLLEHWLPEVVYHCAGEIYDLDKMVESNVLLTNDLLRVSEKIGVKAFVYVGSSSEYGRKDHPINEKDILFPQTLYEATKGCGSLLSLASLVPSITARPFSIYGRGEPLRRFIPLIYKTYKTGEQLKVGPGVHDFIYVDDFVKGLILCAEALYSGKTYKDIVNFGTGVQYTNTEVIEIFQEIVGQKLNWIPSEDKKVYDSNSWVCDTAYAREHYGFSAETTFRTGLEQYIKFREDSTSTNT